VAGQNVEDDTSGVDALGDRFGAGRLDWRQPVREHRGANVDHLLPIAVVDAGELAPHALHRCRLYPVLAGRAVAQGAGVSGEHWHVVPRVISGIAAAARARMLRHDPSVLADYDAVCIGMHSTGRPTALAVTEYLLLSKRTKQDFETDAGTAWKPSNLPAYGTSLGRSASNTIAFSRAMSLSEARDLAARNAHELPSDLALAIAGQVTPYGGPRIVVGNGGRIC
jgi:hypothetical protein